MIQRHLKLIFVFLAAFTLFAACTPPCACKPYDHYDAQGFKIVEVLRQEFPIPIDEASRQPFLKPCKGAYWGPWSYWKSLHREHSSEIIIYGVHDKTIQDRIIERINALREKSMLITFYGDSRFVAHYDEKGNGGMSRLETPILRQETLK